MMQPPAGIEPAPPADVEQPSREPAATGAGAGPILTPDELRALLQEQAPVPPDED